MKSVVWSKKDVVFGRTEIEEVMITLLNFLKCKKEDKFTAGEVTLWLNENHVKYSGKFAGSLQWYPEGLPALVKRGYFSEEGGVFTVTPKFIEEFTRDE